MAEKCLRCGEKLHINIKLTNCPQCGQEYHAYCWYHTGNCIKCGYENPDYKGTEQAKRLAQEKTRQEAEAKRLAEEQARQNAEAKRLAQEQAHQKAEQEKYQARINHLKATGRGGYYEYKVISLVDKKGAVDTERLMAELNDLGLDGWRLQCAYTNEMGKDALSIAGFGINATADQNILIFERFVKFE